MADHSYYQNRDCAYFPCHAGADPDNFNCLFCYCPLYPLAEHCGGNCCFTKEGIKDCSACLFPHIPENYDRVLSRLKDVMELAKKKGPSGENP